MQTKWVLNRGVSKESTDCLWGFFYILMQNLALETINWDKKKYKSGTRNIVFTLFQN